MRMTKWMPLMFLVLIPLLACGKPVIEPTCTMNGLGAGTCSFTNTGTGSGSVCGVIEVSQNPIWETELKKAKLADETDWLVAFAEKKRFQPIRSPVFCSGSVGSKSTVAVDFQVPLGVTCNVQFGLELGSDLTAARKALESPDSGWQLLCVFEFISKE